MSKHLTDAECAAEYWRSLYEGAAIYAGLMDVEEGELETIVAEGETLERFANTPHAHRIEP